MINPSPLWGFGRGGSGGGGVSEARALGIYELIKSCGIEVRIWERQVAGAPRRAPCDLVDASPHRAGSLNFYHPEMQTALLASAEHSGATVKRAVTVLEVIPGDRPRVRARDDGREQTYSANLVIGADGRNSRCRHWAGFQVDQDPKLMWIAGVLLEGLAAPTDRVCLLINPSAGVWSLIAPLGGSRFRAYVGIFKSQGMKPLSGHQALSDFVNASISAGAPSVWFEHMSPVGPLACFEAADQWIRHPYRDGVALIGDAAASNDPSFGCGLSLTLRDVRVLRDRLLEGNDWKRAAHAYAADHDCYYDALHRITGWMRTLFYDPRPAAVAIRAKVLPVIANDPSRVPDIGGLGPEFPSDDVARQRLFGEG